MLERWRMHRRPLPPALAALPLALLTAGLLAACSSAGPSGSAATSSTDGGDAGSTVMPGAEAGTTSPEGGSSSGSDSGSKGPGSDGGGSSAPPPQCATTPVAADFGGIDLTKVPSTMIAGCDAFDAATGVMTLSMKLGYPMLVDSYQGVVRADGNACAAADGTPATVGTLKQILVHGTQGDDALFLDMAANDYSAAFLATPGAFTIDLGTGKNTLTIRGTECDDVYAASTSSTGQTDIDLGAGHPAVMAANVGSLVVSLGPGNDKFTAGGAAPVAVPLMIYGGGGNDALSGGAKSDTINGDEGDDTFDQGAAPAGADILNGGDGHDGVSYASRTHSITVVLCTATSTEGCPAGVCTCGSVNGEALEHDTLVNIEDATGGSGNDTLTGNEQANTLDGNAGDDHLDGQAGDDTLYGDEGTDTLLGGDGDDLLNGGPGAETIDGQTGANICLCGAHPKSIKNCEIMSGC